MSRSLSKTISPADLDLPEVKAAKKRLMSLVWQMFWRGEPFAVNGVSKRRFRIRWHKMWEYARGIAYVPYKKNWRVLDFGGGATLPVYFLAHEGLEVISYDIDKKLTEEARQTAAKRSWPLHATTRDLTSEPLDPEAEQFDWIMSFCVLEHLPRVKQLQVAQHLGTLLKPGGIMSITFDYSPEAPVVDALRGPEDVEALRAATGLEYMDGAGFLDTGERFALDKKYPEAKFTFGSFFLKKTRVNKPPRALVRETRLRSHRKNSG